MNYVVLDLEMCRVPKQYRNKKYKYANEIIQVGAVLLDEEYEIIGRINQYVHPEYGVIDHFISNLTGIQNNQVKHAPSLKEALICCNIEADGRFHDGLDDATNTAKLIKVLELDQNFVICRYEFDEKEIFGFSLGDLFAGLNLECIA